MLDLVGGQGYGSTSVAEVIARAGVSRKAFYQHFANKEECFLATYDTIVAEGFERVAGAAREAGGLQDELGFGLGALFQRAIESPGVERFVLLEVAALGPVGIARREQLISSYEGMLRQNLGATPRPGIIPNPLLRAVVGGYLKVLYTRVQGGGQRRLPALVPDLVRWSFSYLPLPEAMNAIRELQPSRITSRLIGGHAPGTLSPWSTSSRAPASRRTPSLSHSFLVHSQRERILDAVAQLSTEKGYANITLEDLAERAAVSLQTFYEHFADKEDAFLVAYEIGHRKGRAMVERAHDAAPDWPTAVRAGITALLEFLAGEPTFAHMALVDALIATPRTADQSSKGIVRYAELLAPGYDEAPDGSRPPELTIEAIAGGIFELCLTYTVQGHVGELTELAPWATYFALAPFVGTEVAGRVASEPAR
ncbi:MAG TPA: TetR/AcrR family transcriptional regulator [Solirubrobacteraceae bacterium]|nr:TetR/AcrR family transcriptional regulator [Solirubrobacteraceae bacterium]